MSEVPLYSCKERVHASSPKPPGARHSRERSLADAARPPALPPRSTSVFRVHKFEFKGRVLGLRESVGRPWGDGGLVSKARRRLLRSTLGSRVINKKKEMA